MIGFSTQFVSFDWQVKLWGSAAHTFRWRRIRGKTNHVFRHLRERHDALGLSSCTDPFALGAFCGWQWYCKEKVLQRPVIMQQYLDLAANFAMFWRDFRTSGWCDSYMWWLWNRSVDWKGNISVLRCEPAAFGLLFICVSSHANLHASISQHFFTWLRDIVPRNRRRSCFLECR